MSKRLSLRELTDALKKQGFKILRTKGGHDVWHNPEFDRLADMGLVTLPQNLIGHRGAEATSALSVPRHACGDGTIMAIFKRAECCAKAVNNVSAAFAAVAVTDRRPQKTGLKRAFVR